jgi:ABC-type antimicrobial peptide transport system permease subunit
VSRLVTRQGLAVAAIGVAIGVAGARVVTRALSALLFGVGAGDPLVLTAAAVLMLAVALLASWLPARRAAGIEPMQALRSE